MRGPPWALAAVMMLLVSTTAEAKPVTVRLTFDNSCGIISQNALVAAASFERFVLRVRCDLSTEKCRVQKINLFDGTADLEDATMSSAGRRYTITPESSARLVAMRPDAPPNRLPLSWYVVDLNRGSVVWKFNMLGKTEHETARCDPRADGYVAR